MDRTKGACAVTKRGNGEGSISRRSGGGWMAQWWVELPDGTRRRRSAYARTRVEAARRLSEALADRDRGLVYDDTTTVGEYLDRWIKDSVKDTVRQSTFERYAIIVRSHLIPALGKMKLRRLSAGNVRALYRAKLDSGLSGGKRRRWRRDGKEVRAGGDPAISRSLIILGDNPPSSEGGVLFLVQEKGGAQG
jgi:hypothetical protein